MSRPNTPRYKTLNWPSDNKALKRRGSLTIWFDPSMVWAAKPTGKRQKTLAVNIPHRGSQGPLHLLIDSAGIKLEGEGEWNARKHGGPKRRARHCPRTNGGQGSRRKIHLGINEQTLEIRAVEVTSSDAGDAPMLPELLSQIPPDQEIASVTAPSRGLQTNHERGRTGR